MALCELTKVFACYNIFRPLTAFITMDVKDNHAHVTTQRILNKFIDINFSLGCMVWPWHDCSYIFYNSKPETSFVITTVCLFTKWTWASWVIIQLITSHAYQIGLFMDLTLMSVWLWSFWIWHKKVRHFLELCQIFVWMDYVFLQNAMIS